MTNKDVTMEEDERDDHETHTTMPGMWHHFSPILVQIVGRSNIVAHESRYTLDHIQVLNA